MTASLLPLGSPTLAQKSGGKTILLKKIGGVRPKGRTNFENSSSGRIFKVSKPRNIYCGAAFGCQTEPLVFPALFRGRSSKNPDQ